MGNSISENIGYETVSNAYSVPSGDSYKIAEDSLLSNNGRFNYGPLDKPYGLKDDIVQKQDPVEKFKDFYKPISDRSIRNDLISETKYNPVRRVA